MSASAPPPHPGENKQGPPPSAYPQHPPEPPQGLAGYNTQYGMGGGQPSQSYPQQPYGQQPGAYGQQGTTVVVTQPNYAVVQHFSQAPVRVKCRFCQADIITSTFYETGTLTWVACFILVSLGCDAGCCLIPFCVDGCKDVVHSCPNCNQVIGRHNRM